jgi:hypothetical protein
VVNTYSTTVYAVYVELTDGSVGRVVFPLMIGQIDGLQITALVRGRGADLAAERYGQPVEREQVLGTERADHLAPLYDAAGYRRRTVWMDGSPPPPPNRCGWYDAGHLYDRHAALFERTWGTLHGGWLRTWHRPAVCDGDRPGWGWQCMLPECGEWSSQAPTEARALELGRRHQATWCTVLASDVIEEQNRQADLRAGRG